LTRWDATLSKYVGDLLRRGFLTYADLHIADISRQKKNPSNLYRNEYIDIYGHQVTIAPYSNIIIATEKDTVYEIIRDIAQLFGCSCISCKGQNSLGAMEVLVRGILRDEDNTGDIKILTMTDYDPAGYYIAEALEGQVQDIMTAVGGEYNDRRVHFERVGITPNQLDPEMVEANKYTPKPANMEKWFDRTGGINGEPKGLELDALTPVQIRTIFVENLMKYIDAEKYEKFLKESFINKVVLDAISDSISSIEEKVRNEFMSKITPLSFNMKDLAIRGYNGLPIEQLFSNNQTAQISELAQSFINI
jgi:hypothetical protein